MGEKSELKKRALLAKQRLKMGYWQKMQKQREELESCDGSTDKLHEFSMLQKLEYVRENNMVLNRERASKEEDLYNKVCKLLENDDNVSNPIGQLVDKEIYAQMDASNKQRYILELGHKFRELRERYYREQRNCTEV